MKNKFTVDFDRLAEKVVPSRAYRLKDVEHRIERVAYDLVRFRDNADTDQLWKIEDSNDGPVIVALYGDDGGLSPVESSKKTDWDTVPDKTAMHVYYKGEPLVTLSSDQLGIPESELDLARRWLPEKLASDERLQMLLLDKVNRAGRVLIAERFPELTKVAGVTEEDWEDEMEETEAAESHEHFGDDNEADDYDLMSGPDEKSSMDVSDLAKDLEDAYSKDDIKELVDELSGGSDAMFGIDMGMSNDMANPNEDALPPPKEMAKRIKDKLSDSEVEELCELLIDDSTADIEPIEVGGIELAASRIW